MSVTTNEQDTTDPAVAALRAKLIGNRVNIKQIAEASDVTERAAYGAIAKHNIPFVKLFGIRWFEPDDVRKALVADHNTAPRGRGRPRKHFTAN